MKNTIFNVGMFLFCVLKGYGQHQNPVLSNHVQYQGTIVSSLSNNTDIPIEFLPLFKNNSNIDEDIFYSKQRIVQWLSDTCIGLNQQDCIMAMSHRLAKILKSDVYCNSALYPDFNLHWNNSGSNQNDLEKAFAKDFSIPGILTGTYTMQCENYAQAAALLLERTGLIDTRHLRIVNSNHHAFLEIFHDNSWKIVDFDPGTPMFMTVNQLNHTDLQNIGWPMAMNEFQDYKFYSVYSNSEISTVDFLFHSYDSLRIISEWGIYYYQLTNPGFVYPALYYPTDEFESSIVLPSGSRLEVIYSNDYLFMDTLSYPATYNQIKTNLTVAEAALLADDSVTLTNAINHMSGVLTSHFTIDSTSVTQMLLDGFIVFNNGLWKPFFPRDKIPYYSIIIPPGSYQIGSDIKAPGKVLKVECSIGSQLYLSGQSNNDTLITGTEIYQVDFWELYEDTSKIIPNNANHYLQSGWIYATDTVRIDVSWNPAIFNFLHGTMDIAYMQGDSLERLYTINGQPLDMIVNSFAHENYNECCLQVYPNPAHESIWFNMGNIEIFNLNGRKITSCMNCETLSISKLSAGKYILVRNNSEFARFIKE